jgi:hypothetical protein
MPRGYPNSEEARKKQLANLEKGRWKKGQVTNPKGRPPLTMTGFVKEMEAKGYEVPSAETISKSFLYIGTLPEEEIKAILADKTRPMMQRIIAKGILDKKGLDVLERIFDRAYGKTQRIDITSKGEQIKQEPLTVHFVSSTDDYKKIQEEINKEKERKDAGPDRTKE